MLKKDTASLQKTLLLENMAQSVLSDPLYQDELAALLEKLCLRKEKLVEVYVEYDLDIFKYNNDIYNSLEIRMVLHLHNLLKDSWHIDRQKTIDRYVEEIKPKKIIDIGFGVPTMYIRNALKKKTYELTLTDVCDSALLFARTILDLWDPRWQSMITLQKEDMYITSSSASNFDLYIFQDSIEHVPDPAQCLKDFVKNSPKEACFILSLPLGPITPIHYIAWEKEEEITSWLKYCGLHIMKNHKVHVNPNVDLFAEQLHFNYTNVIVLCRKNNVL